MEEVLKALWARCLPVGDGSTSFAVGGPGDIGSRPFRGRKLGLFDNPVEAARWSLVEASGIADDGFEEYGVYA